MSSQFQYFDNSLLLHGTKEYVMGTQFNIVAVGKDKNISEAVWHDILKELTRLNRLLNRFDPHSEIAIINTNAYKRAVAVNDEIWEILTECKDYHKKTLGVFDISLRNFLKIELNSTNQTVRFHEPELLLDLGGYAKGYALRKIARILLGYEVKQAFLNFGNSSILGIGHHPYGDSWKVAINNPYKSGVTLSEVDLVDTSLSTSGNTPQYSKHIVNPATGLFSEEHKLAFAVAKDPVDAEVLSTTMMIAGENDLEKILANISFEDTQIFNLQANEQQSK